MACVCGHAIEEHDPECDGTYLDPRTKKIEQCKCLGYEEADEEESR